MGPRPTRGPGGHHLRYNGGVPGPTLHLRPGDHLGVDLVNRLDEPTNLHTHGLQVCPQANGDNPFVTVHPGRTFHYDYQIPATHPAGTFWYHPHHHGLVADQVFGGLYGAIVIDEPDPPQVSADRVLVISDITLDGAGAVQPVSAMQRMTGREGDLVLVNGQSRPQLTARPGERERRIVNVCVARYLRLRLDRQDLPLLGIDLPLGGDPQQVQEVLLAPGNRSDLLVTTNAGTSSLQALPYDRGTAMGMGMGGMGSPGSDTGNGPVIDLAALAVGGAPAAAPAAIPARPAAADLRATPVTARRTLTLGMSMGMGMGSGSLFTIDGRGFDPARVDQTPPAGAVQERTPTPARWTIPSICTSGRCRSSPSPAPPCVRRPGRTSSTSPHAAAPSCASRSTPTPGAPCITVTSSTTRTTA